MTIREATRSDGTAVAEIFNHYVLNTAVTFETEPLAPRQMAERISMVQNDGYPFYVLEHEERILGFCYLHHWNYRKGFRSTAEMVLYVRNDELHKGYATQLLEHLTANVSQFNLHMILATVTMPCDKSTGILSKFNFSKVGELREIGCKFGEFRNVEQWALML